MGQATIFAGQKIKTLKSTLNLNGGADVISSTVDPTSVATSAEPGSLLLNTTSGKLYRKNDSGSSTNWSEVGSGGSGINYITNPSAATNTTGWATYADAAGAQPVDGTGGSPNVTWTRSTTTPLRGSADFNFAKDAANRQGQGVSTDFTIDLADQAKVLTVTFDYEVLSGTYADGDLTVYLIADPAGTPVVIQPAGYVVQNATVGTKMKQIATFQTQATGQSYRLCFHVASTSASAYTLAVDNVVVGPQVVQYGAPVTDWVSYSVNWTASTTNPVIGNGTLSGQYARIGQNLRAEFAFKAGSTTTFGSGTWFFSIPSGLSIDTSKILLTDPASLYLGTGEIRDATGNVYTINAVYQDATKVALVPDNAGANVQSSIPFTWATGDTLSVRIEVPIAGWSSTVQMSNDTDTRVVATRAASLVAISVANGGETAITMPSITYDTHSGWTSSTEYTIPVNGYYRVTQIVGYTTGTWSGGSFWYVNLLKNGSFEARLITEVYANADTTSGLSGTKTGSATAFYNAGQKLSVIIGQANGAAVSKSFTGGIWVERVSGPSAIAASETVAMRAYKNTGAHTNNGNNQTVASWNSSPFETHGAFNVTTGEYTVPVSGTYLVAGTIGFSPNATGVRALQIEVDLSRKLGGEVRTADGANVNTLNFSGLVTAIAGQKITVSTFQNSGGNLNYDTTSNFNSLSIVRVGN